LTENGPCSVNDDGKTTTPNPYSWTEAAHVLWLDQPAGVGYSYGDENDSGEAMVSEDAYYFFQAFFQTHPEYSNSPLYIIGYVLNSCLSIGLILSGFAELRPAGLELLSLPAVFILTPMFYISSSFFTLLASSFMFVLFLLCT
jgi:hypothetical protein